MPIYAFTGSRKDFLDTKKEYYNSCYDVGDAKNALANILRIYCRMFPLSMPIDEEPTPDQVAIALSDVQDEDDMELDESSFTVEEWKEVLRKREVERLALLKLQGQLQRWFSYRYIKDRAVLQRNDAALKNHPFANLFRRLEGTDKKPRLRSAINVWRQGFSRSVEDVARKEVEDGGASLSRSLAGVRARVGKEMFDSLSQEDREHYQMLAKEEHAGAMSAYLVNKSLGPSTSPDARQRCITTLPSVVQPLLDAIVEATGWKVSLITGGPEPKTKGQMSMIMVHSGTTIGEAKMDWGRFDHRRIADIVMPMYGDFLRKCYSVAECQSRTLADANGPHSLPVEVPAIQLPPPVVAPPTTTAQPPSSPLSRAPIPAILPPSSALTPPPLPPSNNLALPSLDPETESDPTGHTFTPASPPSPPPPPASPPSPPPPTRSPSPAIHSRSPSPMASPSPIPSPSFHRLPAAVDPQLTNPISPPSQPTAAQIIISSHLRDGAVEKRAAEDPVPEGTEGGTKKRKRGIAEGTPAGVPLRTRSTRAVVASTSTTTIPQTPATPHNPPPTVVCRRIRFVCERLFRDGSGGRSARGTRTHGFGINADKRVPARLRPTLVKDWISRGRTRNKAWRPKDFVPKDFKLEFAAWWASLQPSWRLEKGVVLVDRVDGDWSCLVYPGVNGFLSVIAALFFWGLEKQDKAWCAAVEDCTIALRHLTNIPSS